MAEAIATAFANYVVMGDEYGDYKCSDFSEEDKWKACLAE